MTMMTWILVDQSELSKFSTDTERLIDFPNLIYCRKYDNFGPKFGLRIFFYNFSLDSANMIKVIISGSLPIKIQGYGPPFPVPISVFENRHISGFELPTGSEKVPHANPESSYIPRKFHANRSTRLGDSL